MNFPVIIKALGLLYLILATAMVVPWIAGIYLKEVTGNIFGLSAGLIALLGFLMFWLCRKASGKLGSRGAIVLVALVWTSFTLIGAVPFYLSGDFGNIPDAIFESASGFTTTGATVATNIEGLSAPVLLWRSLIQFLGGMGVIVLSIAILPLVGVGGMELYRAEAPGPKTDKISARISETARALWIIYVLFTVIAGITYFALGMSAFDALNHALTTMATGGFSTKANSIAGFNSSAIEIAATIFMLIGGINFVLHLRLFVRGDTEIVRDSELRFYLALFLVCTILITLSVWRDQAGSIIEALRLAAFQVASIISSTGYVTYDYILWSPFAQLVILNLMVVGGCAGSTSGGLKCIRLMMLFKQGVRELHQMLHPRAVIPLTKGGASVSNATASAIFAHACLFVFIIIITSLFQTAMGIDIVTAISTSVSAVANMGPALGDAGPMLSYAGFPDFIKLLLSGCMIVGRLELFTILVMFTSDFWDS